MPCLPCVNVLRNAPQCLVPRICAAAKASKAKKRKAKCSRTSRAHRTCIPKRTAKQNKLKSYTLAKSLSFLKKLIFAQVAYNRTPAKLKTSNALSWHNQVATAKDVDALEKKKRFFLHRLLSAQPNWEEAGKQPKQQQQQIFANHSRASNSSFTRRNVCAGKEEGKKHRAQLCARTVCCIHYSHCLRHAVNRAHTHIKPDALLEQKTKLKTCKVTPHLSLKILSVRRVGFGVEKSLESSPPNQLVC